MVTGIALGAAKELAVAGVVLYAPGKMEAYVIAVENSNPSRIVFGEVICPQYLIGHYCLLVLLLSAQQRRIPWQLELSLETKALQSHCLLGRLGLKRSDLLWWLCWLLSEILQQNWKCQLEL